jgi:hypothetical protein
MDQADDVMRELESLGAVGAKVVLLRPTTKPVVEAEPEPVQEPSREDHTVLQEHLFALSKQALERLDVVATEVEFLRKAFLKLQEATKKGEPHAKVQEEA